MRPDDRTIGSAEIVRVEKAARGLLDRADAWGRFPVPVDDLMEAAKLKVAPHSIFDPSAIAAYAKATGAKVRETVKKAIGKIFGLLDAAEEVIHIDDTVTPGKQLFLKLHEAGHFELPHQKKVFRFFEDSKEELEPSVADLFEREANNFASFVMFNGDGFQKRAQDFQLCFGSVKKLQRMFGVSLYAALREYTRTHRFPCLGVALDIPQFCPTHVFTSEVRRVEVSPSYAQNFKTPSANVITAGHLLGPLVPFMRKATRPTTFVLHDNAGIPHEFIGEALDTTFNVLIFACPTSVFKS